MKKFFQNVWISAHTPASTTGHSIGMYAFGRHWFLPGTYNDNSWIVKQLAKHNIYPEY